METLAAAMRQSRMEHQASTRQHPFSIGENQLRLLALIQMLSNETPLSCRFVRVVTSSEMAGITPAIDNGSNDGCVHDWVLSVFIHECIVHKVLDYELSLVPTTTPACMYLRIPLEAIHDLEQMRASGLILETEFTSTRLSSSTLSTSPFTSGDQRGGRVKALRLTSSGQSKASLLLRSGIRELHSIINADVGSGSHHSVPRYIVWHTPRREFLLCEAGPEVVMVAGTTTMGGDVENSAAASAATSAAASPSRYRSPLPLPPTPLRTPPVVSSSKKKKQKNNNNNNQPGSSSSTAMTTTTTTESVRRALRSTMTTVRPLIPNYVVSPVLLPFMKGRDRTGATVQLRSSNRAVAARFVELHKTTTPTRSEQLADEEEDLNELATVCGTYGVQVVLSRWIPHVTSNTVRLLNDRLTGKFDPIKLEYGTGIGSTRVFDDDHPSNQVGRSSNEMRSNAGERQILQSTSSSVGVEMLSSTSLSSPSSPTSPTSPKSPKRSTKKTEPGSPSSVRSGRRGGGLLGVGRGLPNPKGRGVRVVEILGITSSSGGRSDLRSVFTAECIDEGTIGQLGESTYSVESDGCVVSTSSVDCIGSRVAYVASTAEASRVTSSGGGGGVSLNKLSQCVVGLQLTNVDVLRRLMMDGGDNSSLVAQGFTTVHGSGSSSNVSSGGGSSSGTALSGNTSCGPEPCSYVYLSVGSVRPFMKPNLYLDGSEYHLRLVQLIGTIESANDLGRGETLFVGKRGTLLISKRPEGMHSDLIEHSRIMSRDMALCALSSQVEWIGRCILRLKLERGGGDSVGGVSAERGSSTTSSSSARPPLSSGHGCDDSAHLATRLRDVLGCIDSLLCGMSTSSSESPQSGIVSASTVTDPLEVELLEALGEKYRPETTGMMGGGGDEGKTSYGIVVGEGGDERDGSGGSGGDKVRLLELRRVLQVSSARRAVQHRGRCLMKECQHLLKIAERMEEEETRRSIISRGGGESGGGIMNITSGEQSNGGGGFGGGRGSGSSGGGGFSTTSWGSSGSLVLLSGVVGLLVADATIINETLPWGSERDLYSYLGLCFGLWCVFALMFVWLVPLWRRRKCCCCGGRNYSVRGPRIHVHVAPFLRVRTTSLERSLLSKVDIVSDQLIVPRFAIGSGGGSGSYSKRERRGVRTIVFREPAVRLGWPSSVQWTSRTITSTMVLVYEGRMEGVGGDVATLRTLSVEVDAAPPKWPFKWLHELVLSKWLQRLEELDVCTMEDHHVCRQVLRLNNTVGVGNGF